jgi:hypothetical protein
MEAPFRSFSRFMPDMLPAASIPRRISASFVSVSRIRSFFDGSHTLRGSGTELARSSVKTSS